MLGRGSGDDPKQDLIDAVPTAAHWRLAGILEIFSREGLLRLLKCFQEWIPRSRGVYAMLRCMSDLGLRACEVQKLRLEDINWSDGIIALPTGRVDLAAVCRVRIGRRDLVLFMNRFVRGVLLLKLLRYLRTVHLTLSASAFGAREN